MSHLRNNTRIIKDYLIILNEIQPSRMGFISYHYIPTSVSRGREDFEPRTYLMYPTLNFVEFKTQIRVSTELLLSTNSRRPRQPSGHGHELVTGVSVVTLNPHFGKAGKFGVESDSSNVTFGT
ncbi:hypothetical protein TNCV_679341 [Trichonephila clavipes]|nr:hypothetical protein TNCV_679341 [Trichonephila clavipes]